MKAMRVYFLLLISLLLLGVPLYGLLVGTEVGELGPAYTLEDTLPESWDAARETFFHAWAHGPRP